MKKILALLLLLLSVQANAQTRYSLYEEFTGENCSPCAAANTGLQTLLNSNTSSVIGITYQGPLPSPGPIYSKYRTVTDARYTYYGITNVPSGRLNGTKTGTGTASSVSGHVSNLTQTDISTESGSSTPFTMTVSHAWNAAGDSIIATINITAASSFSPSGGNLKLRVALIESLLYNTAPGTNGERSFPNVVREMYPNAGGTALPSSWTAAQNQTVTVKGIVPAYVNKANSKTMVVAWIQNDADKAVLQVARSAFVPLILDAGSLGHNTIKKLQCVASSTSLPSSVVLNNGGTTPLTSAKIYYRVDNGPNSVYSWTGNLGAGASTLVNLPVMSVGGGNHYFVDSVGQPNGSMDINIGNNLSSGLVNIFNTTKNSLPIASGFELGGAMPPNWLLYDADSNNLGFTISKSTSTTQLGHGSAYFLRHANYIIPSGEVNYAILPSANLPSNDWTLEFWMAHAQYDSENDKLEVVYSTDCGANWTSVYSEAGATLATAPATHNYFEPSQADWAHKLLILNGIPAGALIAFRATSNFGNNLYIDDVHIHTGTGAAGVENLIANQSLSLYPNPTRGDCNLDFDLNGECELNVGVYDVLGRNMQTIASGKVSKGRKHLPFSTRSLPAGVYQLILSSDNLRIRKRLIISQ